MENLEILTNLILYSIIPSSIALVATKMTEGRIKSSFDKRLEETKKEHTLEIAKFQNELDSLKAKENFKFTKLHEERFNVLKKTYALLNKSRNDLALYVSEFKIIPNNTTAENNLSMLNENFRKSHEEFIKYVDDNLIFFSENLESIIDDFTEECFKIFLDYDASIVLTLAGIGNDDYKRKAVSAYKRLNDNIQPIMITIRTEFRELLGANL